MFRGRFFVLVLAVAFFTNGLSSALPANGGSRDRIVMQAGDVILFPTMAAPSDCPSDYVCVWANPEFLGSMVALRDCCTWYNLAGWGFNNATSSWRNRKSVDAKIADFSDGNGDRLCLSNGGQSGSMGNWDNRATSLKIFSGPGAC